jgi:hypothetical protein
VEEQHVAGFEHDRYRGEPAGQRHRDVGEADPGVRLGRAQDRPAVACGYHAQATVVLIRAVQCEPGRHARTRLGAQVEVVLVHRLTAGTGRLEVQHRLHRERLRPEQVGEQVADPRVQQPAPRGVVPAVHLRHPRVPAQRIAAGRVDADEVIGVGTPLTQRHEVCPQPVDLRCGEERPGHHVPVPVERGLG